jgi:hypothetical protein
MNLLEKHHIELRDVQKAQSWFDSKLKAFGNIRAATLIKQGERKTATIKPGHLFLFAYDPLHADTLPYYDTYPLVFPISATDTTFTGLNMHYLPYPLRFALFRELLRISGATNLTDDKKMLLKWETIRGMSKLAPLQACIKQYRYDHVGSPFVDIKPSDWTTTMLLPVHSFKKSSADAVWRDTKKVRGW